MLSIDSVADACVIGLPDERSGEAPRAYVVPKEGAQLTEESILEALKPQLAPYKMPRAPSATPLGHRHTSNQRTVLYGMPSS